MENGERPQRRKLIWTFNVPERGSEMITSQRLKEIGNFYMMSDIRMTSKSKGKRT